MLKTSISKAYTIQLGSNKAESTNIAPNVYEGPRVGIGTSIYGRRCWNPVNSKERDSTSA